MSGTHWATTEPVEGGAQAACTSGSRDQHVVNDLADIPAFASEDEEDAYWSTHSLGQAILDQMQPIQPTDPDSLPARPSRSSHVESEQKEAGTIERAVLLEHAWSRYVPTGATWYGPSRPTSGVIRVVAQWAWKSGQFLNSPTRRSLERISIEERHTDALGDETWMPLTLDSALALQHLIGVLLTQSGILPASEYLRDLTDGRTP